MWGVKLYSLIHSDGRPFQVFAAATQNARSLDVSVVRQDPLMTQNVNVVDVEDRRHDVDCQSDMLVRDPSDTETRVLPA